MGFYLDTTNENDRIGTAYIEILNSSESKTVDILTSIAKAGKYNIFVKADPFNFISEINEENNTTWKEITIVKKADLIVEDIQFQVSTIENEVDTNISAIIKNPFSSKICL